MDGLMARELNTVALSMPYLTRVRGCKILVRVGVSPKKATSQEWRHVKAVLRKHNDLNMAEHALRKRFG
jgi:hypothetical protein